MHPRKELDVYILFQYLRLSTCSLLTFADACTYNVGQTGTAKENYLFTAMSLFQEKVKDHNKHSRLSY